MVINQEYIQLQYLGQMLGLFKHEHTNDHIYIRIAHTNHETYEFEDDNRIVVIRDIYLKPNNNDGHDIIFDASTIFDDEVIVESCSNGRGVMVHQFLRLICEAMDEEDHSLLPSIKVVRFDNSSETFHCRGQFSNLAWPNDIIKSGNIIPGDAEKGISCKIFLYCR